jgi:phage baseplate assembly protein W
MYYKIPFDFGKIIAGRDAELSSGIAENIAQHIQLLITTKFGENRYDSYYGNAIWDLEFENALTDAQWEDRFSQSVASAVTQYEPRLKNPKVSIHSELIEKVWPIKEYTEIKKRVVIVLKAILTDTNEAFSFKTELFLSPMSVD